MMHQDHLFAALQTSFGYDSFRPGQRETIEALLAGQDVLAIMPTGAGKSLTYQLAAQLLPGLTIVVSPLIALMQDQVASLRKRGVDVTLINSTLGTRAARDALAAVRDARTKLVYVAPERFNNRAFRDAICGCDVSLFVVDEAHCVSDWGHAFRPAYLHLQEAITCLKQRPAVLALTATATPWVRDEIVARLGLRDPQTIVRGTDRPNLHFEVHSVQHEHDDRRVLKSLLDAAQGDNADEQAALMQGSGIIYVATTRKARETAAWLQSWGIAADFYHGQRKKHTREAVQNAFMRGDLRVIVATNAFGLGVDKGDVRWVIHRDTPASLEAYYQEAGRAGRDGQLARCVLIYRAADLGTASFLGGAGRLTPDEVARGLTALRAANGPVSRAQLGREAQLNTGDVARLVAILRDQRIVRVTRTGIRLQRQDTDAADVSLASEDHRAAYERSRVDMMRGYAETDGCRRRFLLHYFGETAPDACDRCDNDGIERQEHRVQITAIEAVASRFKQGDSVAHAAWGPGVIQSIAADTMTILFEHVGFKTLATAIAQDQGLLRSMAS